MSRSERSSKIRSVILVSSDNCLEMYDFMIYGYYATAIAAAFFPTGNEFASLMLSLATFGAGLLMRPIGAIVLGAYIDRHVRRAGLLLTLGLMAIGTLSIASLPGYATLGILAPLLVLVARLMQGLSAGAEVGGVSVYLSEIATRGHKGFCVSWQSASQQGAVIVIAILGIVLSSTLSPGEIRDWGWRIPMLVGCLLIPFLFIIRRSLEETREFLVRKLRLSEADIVRSIAANWAHRAARHHAGDDVHRVLLFHHGVYADVR